ncbi:DUF3140 domain-containing protein [Aureimonas leprariae]|uniref:DUF3140 domain-containing protein n=1 Tax=Plantimonas leprariae TaxID=2615207 RepID=A0A7V7TZI6_9HYPH|nr:DUF3140 domain-containing protein [Aureimonas leprariae]KAB0679407.1 DUF3140 domain-containing protein [Aureimonas leprariae]
MAKDHDEIWSEWQAAVNMTPAALKKWLDTEESKSVGDTQSGAKSSGKTGGGESTGHKSGHRIVEIKAKKKTELDEDDWEHMAKVVGYVNRHLKQRPKGDTGNTNWAYSLKNWGHDPAKD